MPRDIRAEKKQRWLIRGADAFGRLGLDTPKLYVCPLCLHGFDLDSHLSLTFEHVPPRSVGGSTLALTCLQCNGSAGGKEGVDTHASTAETLRKFGEGTLQKLSGVG